VTVKLAALEGAGKRFGARVALHDVTLELRAGEVLAVLGPNGAGKTTALSLLLGLRRPETGKATLLGRDPRDPAARRHVGATPQETAFPPTLRVREILELARVHFAKPAPLPELLERFGLATVAARQAGGLSGGEKRRLAVALAFAGKPQAVFLDEPTTGLDVEARRALWTSIRTYADAGGGILLTTHYLEEAQALAGRVVVLHEGRVAAEGAPDSLARRVGLARVRVRGSAPDGLAGVERVELDGARTTLYTADVDGTVRALVDARVPLDELEVLPASLEEAFVAVTRGDA
jgi:ABC-2 type transport system ATP-binding protein